VYFLWMLDDMVTSSPYWTALKIFLLTKILGKTSSTEAIDSDLSIDVLVADFYELIQILFPDPSNCPTFLVNITFLFRSWIFVDCFFLFFFSKLVGHSMGGSVMVRSCPRLIEKRYRIVGVVVLDVVEGNHIYIYTL
jgi:protein phosphatase methylesterase 1